MLQTVDIATRRLDDYRGVIGPDAFNELRALAAPLRGARVLQINATPYGGGVSELLRSLVPLERDLGLVADWKIISGDEAFFDLTKRLHNGLQGAGVSLSSADRDRYLAASRANARQLEEEYDVIIVHDPQPAALLGLHGKGTARWIWRCHIDTGSPDTEAWHFLRPHLEGYDAAVFTMGDFVPPDLPIERRAIIPPAIDPLSPKNMDLDRAFTDRVLGWIGIDPELPLVTQVSRFDPWKDPLGVIAAYRLACDAVPDLQLALVGSMALDDPEGWTIYRQIEEATHDDPLIHVFTNLTGVGNLEVNAFQRRSRIVIQKSRREGFGLVVAEALWKGTPVVAGRVGGIPLQMPDGTGGYLVDSVEGCAQRLVELLQAPDLAASLGGRGQEHVRQHYLLSRLLADELRLIGALQATEPLAVRRWEREAALGARDPVCGMPLLEDGDRPTTTYQGRLYAFCREECRRRFRRSPELYLASVAVATGRETGMKNEL
jgi:trehalose synthase